MLLRVLLLLLLAAPVAPAAAYSVLTHQAVIDSTWEPCLVPLLRQRYPGATAEEWTRAKSYAYGGAIVQDLGYYPLGTKFFTNLTHYVRAGDFVRSLLGQAHNRDEYAFALGALAHYAADNTGHPLGTNLIMASVYPKLQATYGPVITYEDAPKRHTELEFSFDVVQIAAGRFRSQEYHKFIGFRVSKPVLERAFLETYGLELGQVLFDPDLDVATFRFAVNQLLPAAARAAWQSQRKEIRRLSPRARRREYLYRANRREFRKEFGTSYERPGLGARLVALVLKVLPKIGPLKTYAFTLPDAAGEAQFRRSYRAALAAYCALAQLQPTDTSKALPLLPDSNLDTGEPTQPATYALADATYAKWLRALYQHNLARTPLAVRHDLARYFAQGLPLTQPKHGKKPSRRKARKERRESEAALAELRALPQ
ncbi:zinc dependent phospholipase C family protein [Hymenobacter sp. BT770]|uniref:zinc dependent phospholipase C family protein n=1 Tax=Hymenobacter sp. BT770 TaxID=2886942 RepID=UPI001D11C22F|nr:zinc dependent phospholipase C family protein [Hymenobacter sp. BT770]MCC3152096.1 zinc dependent phospholipase C family protein [Hymenobacter sp. BT770]MDO3415221.1 zinc dependent phospholipase C family protein [Hymenobacter sp. BT770]